MEIYLPFVAGCLTFCFHLLLAQAAYVELLCRISFLLEFELQFELATDETVPSAALRTCYRSRLSNVFQVLLVHKHIVWKIPMFEQRIHPCCFQVVFLLQDCIGNS